MIKILVDSVGNYMFKVNLLVRTFHMCFPDVKVALFRAYCTPLYTAHMWCNFKKSSLYRLNVAYNDATIMLLRVPRYFSASQMFVEFNVPACSTVLRNLMYKFIQRVDVSENGILKVVSEPLVKLPEVHIGPLEILAE